MRRPRRLHGVTLEGSQLRGVGEKSTPFRHATVPSDLANVTVLYESSSGRKKRNPCVVHLDEKMNSENAVGPFAKTVFLPFPLFSPFSHALSLPLVGEPADRRPLGMEVRNNKQ